MPTITVSATADPLPDLNLGEALPGYTLTSGADPAAGAGLVCPAGSGPAVTGNGYSYDRNFWTWSCIKSWVTAEPLPIPTASSFGTGDNGTPVPMASAATGSTVEILATDDVTVSLAVRSLNAGDRVSIKAMRGSTVVKRWTATAGRSGRIAAHVPKSLRGSRIVITAHGRVVFNRVVR